MVAGIFVWSEHPQFGNVQENSVFNCYLDDHFVDGPCCCKRRMGVLGIKNRKRTFGHGDPSLWAITEKRQILFRIMGRRDP